MANFVHFIFGGHGMSIYGILNYLNRKMWFYYLRAISQTRNSYDYFQKEQRGFFVLQKFEGTKCVEICIFELETSKTFIKIEWTKQWTLKTTEQTTKPSLMYKPALTNIKSDV